MKLTFSIYCLFLGTLLSAQWVPVEPLKLEQKEAFVFFYDYLFSFSTTYQEQLESDSTFLKWQELENYKLEKPLYLVEVMVAPNRYHYYILRTQTDSKGSYSTYLQILYAQGKMNPNLSLDPEACALMEHSRHNFGLDYLFYEHLSLMKESKMEGTYYEVYGKAHYVKPWSELKTKMIDLIARDLAAN